ncbi:IS3 family transposase, partial [Limosilactobacillus fermentum]
EHWWADFKSIWLAHSPQPQTFEDLEQLVTEGTYNSLKSCHFKK